MRWAIRVFRGQARGFSALFRAASQHNVEVRKSNTQCRSAAVQCIVIDLSDPKDIPCDAVGAACAFLSPGDRVCLFHCVHDARLDTDQHQSNDLLDEARRLLLAKRRDQLGAIARQFSDQDVILHVAWSSRSWQSLLQFAEQEKATLIVAPSHRQGAWRPLARANEDWQLIRHSSAPLLLTRGARRDGYRRVMAAVDPLHIDDKPAELDHRILAHAKTVAERHDAALCVLNVMPPPAPVAMGTPMPAVPSQAVIDDKCLQARRKRVKTLLDESGCQADDVCVVPGTAATEIVAHAAQHNTDLVVMGAVSRSLLHNALIGSTAEKVLDRLNADTLIIKPAVAGAPPP